MRASAQINEGYGYRDAVHRETYSRSIIAGGSPDQSLYGLFSPKRQGCCLLRLHLRRLPVFQDRRVAKNQVQVLAWLGWALRRK